MPAPRPQLVGITEFLEHPERTDCTRGRCAFFFGQLASQVGLTMALSVASALPVIAALLFLTIPAGIVTGHDTRATAAHGAVASASDA